MSIEAAVILSVGVFLVLPVAMLILARLWP